MHQSCLFAILIIQQMGPTPQGPKTADEIQRDGIRHAVADLRKQITQLASEAGRTPSFVEEQPKDMQDAVVALTDLMSDNVLLTRAYLALAVAEHKMITLESCATCLPMPQKRQYLRHIEAIQFAIDDRILEPQDIRVLRVLQAGVNQAIREELTEERPSATNTQYYVVRGRCAGVGLVPRRRFCRR